MANVITVNASFAGDVSALRAKSAASSGKKVAQPIPDCSITHLRADGACYAAVPCCCFDKFWIWVFRIITLIRRFVVHFVIAFDTTSYWMRCVVFSWLYGAFSCAQSSANPCNVRHLVFRSRSRERGPGILTSGNSFFSFQRKLSFQITALNWASMTPGT